MQPYPAGNIYVWASAALVRADLLKYNWDNEQGKFIVDWTKTTAFPYSEPPYIWVNLKGREPDGIVEPKDYEFVREKIIDALYNIRDPKDGRCPIELAIKRENAEFLGQNGERVGDVVYYLKPSYQLFDGSMDMLYHDVVSPEMFGKGEVRNAEKLFGYHACYLPTARLGRFTVSSVLIMSGPRIKRGEELAQPVRLVDIAPTISFLLGISKPAQSEGRILYEVIS